MMSTKDILEEALDQTHLNAHSKFSGGGRFHFNTKSAATAKNLRMEIVEAIHMVSEGSKVSGHMLDLLKKISMQCRYLKWEHAMIFNLDPKGGIAQFYGHTQFINFGFQIQSGSSDQVYCPLKNLEAMSGRGLEVRPNTLWEEPYWCIERDGVYVYDGETMELVMNAKAILEKTQSLWDEDED